MMTINNRHRLLLRVSALVAVVVCAKLAVHSLGWEIISINPLFSGIVAANVFLMGFLLSGVLSDFKESERLPGELSACLENLAQEVSGLRMAKPEAKVGSCLILLSQLSEDILSWFHKKHRTAELLEHLNALTPQFAAMEQWTQATLVARLKQEQSNLRRTLIRIHTIRETSFISSGYLLADLVTILLCIGLIFAKIEPFYESLFFVGVIAYLMIFLLMLIRDLDNPFGYYDRSSGEDVSLKPLEDTVGRLAQIASVEQGAAPNGDPAKPLDNSRAAEGQPPVL
jgi:predicted membrane chloride channel (bestrophin family)